MLKQIVSCIMISGLTVAVVPVSADEDLARQLRLTAAGGLKTHECVARSISCGQTLADTITPFGCVTSSGSTYFDVWQFQGVPGQRVTLDMSSTDLDPFLLAIDPDGNDAGSDDDSGPGLDAQLVIPVDQSGAWTFSASGLLGTRETGAYTIRMTCSGTSTGGCTPSGTTLCLNNGRFKVQATFRTGQGQTGTANVVALTPDTGYLWFFNPSNVEAVIKVLDACALNHRFWVFAGGLTDVNVVITVTDTQTGATKEYRNSQGTPFAPIQDTNALACQ